MLRSMTAFARVEQDHAFGRLAWELRSVNHRYLDVAPRLPEELRSLEPAVRERVAARLGRGKVEAVLRLQLRPEAGAGLPLDLAAAQAVIEALGKLAALLPAAAAVNPMDVLRWPGVVPEAERDFTPVAQAALALLERALEELVAARSREGARLAAVLEQRRAELAALVEAVAQRRPEVLARIRARLETRLAELAVEVDRDRLAQELVYYAQRLDVDEELDRLRSHLAELARLLALEGDEPVGRRLDFLIQELNREANTLAAKANDAQTTQAAVDMKVLIEQLREQAQNVE